MKSVDRPRKGLWTRLDMSLHAVFANSLHANGREWTAETSPLL